jgi:hypothetical protein
MTTQIHEACAREGCYVIAQGSAEPIVVIPKLLDALRELSSATYEQLTIPGCGFSFIPAYAMNDGSHEWWNGQAATDAMALIIAALNEHAPEGFEIRIEEGDRWGFFRIASDEPRESMIRSTETPEALRRRILTEVIMMTEAETKLLEKLKKATARQPIDRKAASDAIDTLRFRHGWTYNRFASEIPDYEAIAMELDCSE